MSKKRRTKDLSDLGGLVYSTNPDEDLEPVEEEILKVAPNKQKLFIRTDKKQRKGKIVTLVLDFEGDESDLSDLARELKSHCGTGGSAKDGEIIIQGDFKSKVADYLKKKGYGTKIQG